ncbi:uncharacterized protein SPPG_00559 [Spizellomyces punctatus DAOM BR117]|uniref:CBF1-interacting co-repressor CIR N-terminal domain-containing protein n=1 Tax=Spizellomyces punctatus (strain DAOM BR117) TaxID=645134 RepID=A0A0L0HVD5_SPIPD|nr:uncharacterized protein SPPG_00559 [Spizellomyces punctatus DAOM BR117]KND04860.1 hypothetical protein SPPG_00559 [Spizellomyces punctatus DAOM BR117]|eukprot:XP_016612899.1 hypothetical protein SPPG_00559 [Spizellomyces punctatus DAOM BR117]
MGKLNILQHKSWHVYNEVNQERVRKDEEAARIEEEKKKERALQADREARLALLRSKSRGRIGSSHAEVLDVAPNEVSTALSLPDTEERHIGHVNLFEEAEREARGKGGKNPEYEAEKRAKEKKEADKFTWYLGETKDGKKETPWYATLDLKSDKKPQEGPAGLIKDEKARKAKDERRKAKEDPLNAMTKYVSKSERRERERQAHSERRKRATKTRESSSSSSSNIEKLRAERLARERVERAKAQEVLQPGSALPTRHFEDSAYYHSQFNPDFVRRRRDEAPARSRRHEPY